MSDLAIERRRLDLYSRGKVLTNIAKLDAVIQYAASIQDWSLVEAIDQKIEEIISVVLWWDANVGRKSNEYPTLIPVDEAKQKTGLTKLQISRWRRAIGISGDGDLQAAAGAVTRVAAAEGRADRAEQAVADERTRADAVRARLDAMQEQLAAEAEAAEQARRQAQIAQDNAEILREADAARKGRGRLARLRAAWRGK